MGAGNAIKQQPKIILAQRREIDDLKRQLDAILLERQQQRMHDHEEQINDTTKSAQGGSSVIKTIVSEGDSTTTFTTKVNAKRATRVLVLNVACYKYDKVRTLDPRLAGFIDIPEALTDIKSFELGAQTLTIYRKEDVWELIDPDHKQIHQAILEMRNKGRQIVADGKAAGRKEIVVVAVYYAGHGTQDGYNYALLNEMSEEETKRVAAEEKAQSSKTANLEQEESKQSAATHGQDGKTRTDASSPLSKVRVYSIEKSVREILASKEGFFAFYIHHACREPHNVEKFDSAFQQEVNFVGIYSSPPYGLVGKSTVISTTFWKQMRAMANKINGDILFPNFDLLTWKVGSYGGFLDNKKVGDVAAHLKFPVILTDKDIKWAAENGQEYVTGKKGAQKSGKESVYDGFVNEQGERHGPGVMTLEGQVQDGNWANDELNGLSMTFFPNDDGTLNEESARYNGQYKNHKRHGHGYYVYPSGTRYFGEWQDGEEHGQGTQTWASGNTYVGSWQNGNKHGQGTYTWVDGNTYVGSYENDNKHGQGTYTDANGNMYVGSYEDGNKHGQGTFTFSNGNTEKGMYKGGKEIGSHVFTPKNGEPYLNVYNDEGKCVEKQNMDGTKKK